MLVVKADIFESNAEVLVNPVNCVGVMGAGLAKKFKERFDGLEQSYRAGCKSGELGIGRVHWFTPPTGPAVANFATKMDWRVPSTLGYIEKGLTCLVTDLTVRGYTSVAIPALGCGLGGLDFEDVKKLVENAFKDHPDITVLLYEPN